MICKLNLFDIYNRKIQLHILFSSTEYLFNLFTCLNGFIYAHRLQCSGYLSQSLQLNHKEQLDMHPLPRARVKLGGWTRSPRFW